VRQRPCVLKRDLSGLTRSRHTQYRSIDDATPESEAYEREGTSLGEVTRAQRIEFTRPKE
jgi:hypothetical protein